MLPRRSAAPTNCDGLSIRCECAAHGSAAGPVAQSTLAHARSVRGLHRRKASPPFEKGSFRRFDPSRKSLSTASEAPCRGRVSGKLEPAQASARALRPPSNLRACARCGRGRARRLELREGQANPSYFNEHGEIADPRENLAHDVSDLVARRQEFRDLQHQHRDTPAPRSRPACSRNLSARLGFARGRSSNGRAP
jgi:hypothetical protein